MESLHLGFISDRVAPFYEGGYERHLASLAQHLSKQHEVTIYTSLQVPRVALDGVQYIRVAPHLRYTEGKGRHSLLQSLYFGGEAPIRVSRLGSLDFLDVQGIPYSHVPLTKLRVSAAGVRWGITIWEVWSSAAYFDGPVRLAAYIAFRSLLRLAVSGHHRILVGSVRVKEAIEEQFAVSPERIGIVTPHIDVTRYSPALGIERDIDVVFVGRLAAYKRPVDLVRSLAKLGSGNANLKACIVGTGPEADGLRDEIRRLGLRESVTLAGGVTEQAKIDLLRRAKLFVLPSEREGFSIATLEAMACGAVPIVAMPSDPGAFGVSDLLRNGSLGIVYPCGSVQALSQSISTLLDFPSRLRQLSRDVVMRAGEYDDRFLAGRYLAAIGLQ